MDPSSEHAAFLAVDRNPHLPVEEDQQDEQRAVVAPIAHSISPCWFRATAAAISIQPCSFSHRRVAVRSHQALSYQRSWLIVSKTEDSHYITYSTLHSTTLRAISRPLLCCC